MNQDTVEARFIVADNGEARELFGKGDENIRAVEKMMDVTVIHRAGDTYVVGHKDAVDKAIGALTDLQSVIRSGLRVSQREARYAAALALEGRGESLAGILSDVIQVTARGKQIRPRTIGQKRYVDAIRRNGIVFGIGPAGTGKTYLAMAMAITAFKNKEVSRIVLTRPAVEAGEKLGFLPGDLQEKVDPYLRPLYDALFDIMGLEVFERYKEKGAIEIAPLAYMRGRTLDDAFIILDEAQNTTREQMKMFLTRLGFSSKAVVTGDITQIDLPKGQTSGLLEVQTILSGIEGIAIVHLSDQDVVRHELVQKIIRAYEQYEPKNDAEAQSADAACPK